MYFQTLDAVFEILDYNEKGELDYSVYLMTVIGCMVEARKALVRKVIVSVYFEPRHKKTHLWVLGPVKTQTGLLS